MRFPVRKLWISSGNRVVRGSKQARSLALLQDDWVTHGVEPQFDLSAQDYLWCYPPVLVGCQNTQSFTQLHCIWWFCNRIRMLLKSRHPYTQNPNWLIKNPMIQGWFADKIIFQASECSAQGGNVLGLRSVVPENSQNTLKINEK